VWGGLVVVVLAAVIFAAASSSGGSSSSDGSSGNAKATKYEQAPVQVGGAALAPFSESTGDAAVGDTIPTLTGVSVFDGSPVVVKPTGKPQAVVFLAHWCPHCQAEMPRLVALAKAGKLAGIDVTGVATGTNPGYPNYPPSAWLKNAGWPFPVLADSTTDAAARAFGVTGYPSFVLIDGTGKVVGRAAGEVSDDDIVANVKALVAGTPLPLLKSGASTSVG
jgi:thiol-disulfide isomerase/thioredoxin